MFVNVVVCTDYWGEFILEEINSVEACSVFVITGKLIQMRCEFRVKNSPGGFTECVFEFPRLTYL
jgi:hypothetical protein